MNFCDSPLYSPIKHLTRAGPVVVERAMKIVNEYTLAFFDETLNARRNGLLDGPSPGHPDVHFEAWKPQTPRPEAGILGRETREIEARFSGGPPDLTAADAPGSHR